MNIKQRLICLFKGHDHVFHIYLDSIEVNAECSRCGHRLSPREASWILRTSTIKEIEQ